MKKVLAFVLCAAAAAAFVSDGNAESNLANQQVAEPLAMHSAAQASQPELQIQTQPIQASYQLAKSEKSNTSSLYPTLNVFSSNKKYTLSMQIGRAHV